MLILKRVALFGAVTVLASAPLVSVGAQTQSPTPPSASPPAATQPVPAPIPQATPSTRPVVPGSGERNVVAPIKNPLIGLPVFSSDGYKLGIVDSIDGQPDGKVAAINIRTGGFLGFGTKLVAIPEGKFQIAGVFVQIDLTAEEVSKLPAVKDNT
jgi:PRC-barrel domain protein